VGRPKGLDLSKNLANQINEEEVLLEAFYAANPDFAGEALAGPPEQTVAGFDPPDVMCITASGKRVGIEVCQWAPQNAMADGNLREQADEKVLEAIGPQPLNNSQHFSLVVFRSRTNSHLLANEHGVFRKAMFDLIEYVNGAWPTIRRHAQPHPFRDLGKFRPLNNHLEDVTFCPPNGALDAAVEKAIETCGGNTASTSGGGSDWIVPAGRSQWVRTLHDDDRWEPDASGNLTMEGCLLKMLRKKAGRCSEPKLKTPCAEVHLVVAFHQAIPYCPPIPKMQDVAKRAADRARRSTSWPFARTFLLIAVEDKPTVFRLL
jgi:hypothetical protein